MGTVVVCDTEAPSTCMHYSYMKIHLYVCYRGREESITRLNTIYANRTKGYLGGMQFAHVLALCTAEQHQELLQPRFELKTTVMVGPDKPVVAVLSWLALISRKYTY